MEPLYRPYRDTITGKLVMLTDEEFAAFEPNNPYRRIRPGEAEEPASVGPVIVGEGLSPGDDEP